MSVESPTLVVGEVQLKTSRLAFHHKVWLSFINMTIGSAFANEIINDIASIAIVNRYLWSFLGLAGRLVVVEEKDSRSFWAYYERVFQLARLYRHFRTYL